VVEALLDSLPTNSSAVFGRSLAGEPPASFALPPDRAISLTIATKAQVFRPANVVALVEGSDPQLKNEFVTIQAHLDGIVNWIQQPDTIGNAADDNASGVAALLAVAEAFSRAPRPKRSILFLWDTGEEQGNFGTQHFIASNAIPIEKIAAHFNLDMIGRSGEAGDHDPKGETLTGPNEVYVIGPRSLSTGLTALIDGVNDSYRGIEYNHSHDTWDNQWMYRGEHLWCNKKGIPSALYFSGMHREYHNTSDNPGLINSSKVTRVARTVFVTTWMVANAQTRPRIDKPLPPNVKP
jgi:Zn-dependent M28 family amino/carboxypeptidase